MGREILDIAAREVRPGVTTDYIDEVVHKATIERNVCILSCLDVTNAYRHILRLSTMSTFPNQSAPL
jgi:hypothetical protein